MDMPARTPGEPVADRLRLVGRCPCWMREEFEAIGAPPYEARGQVTDEYIEAFRAMWTSDEPTYEGEYARVADIYFRPQPVRKPHPPIWIGGDSMPALRRAARLGDGWLPVGLAPKRPLNTVARYRDAAETLADLARHAGRDPAEIALTYWAIWYDETKRITLDDGSRHIFTGEAAEIAADINALLRLPKSASSIVRAISAVLFTFVRSTLDENVEHGLGYEGASQRRAVLLRPPYLAAEVGQKSLNPHQFQNRDEQLVALAHRAKLALEPREQLLLKGVPVIR